MLYLLKINLTFLPNWKKRISIDTNNCVIILNLLLDNLTIFSTILLVIEKFRFILKKK